MTTSSRDSRGPPSCSGTRRGPSVGESTVARTNSPAGTSPTGGDVPLRDTGERRAHPKPRESGTRTSAGDLPAIRADLKNGLGPSIEDCIRGVAGPQRSALLSMLAAAELRFRVRAGERPALEEYRRRFPESRASSKRFSPALSARRGSARSACSGSWEVGTSAGSTSAGTRSWTGWSRSRCRGRRFSGPEDVDRFLREARLAARIKHPGIVTVYQVDRDPDVGCFVVLEYIEGQSLSAS